MTFDLERARGLRDFLQDDCAEVGDVWAEMIAEIERLRASLTDLHAEYINTLEKNPGCSAWDLDEQSIEDQRRLRRNAAHAISIVEPPIYLQADQQATKILELEAISRRRNEIINKQVAKIKELKADLEQSEICIQARLDVIDQQAARIKSLKKEIRRLKHESKVEQEFTNSYIKRLHDAEARIKELGSSLDEAEALTKKNAELMNGYLRRIAELEDALVEGLTNFLHYRASCYDPARRCPYAKECDDCSTWDACGHVEKFRSEARRRLQAEGKIGPDAKPRSWQITEERKAALAAMSNLSETISCPDCGVWIGFADIGPHMAVLRAMLTEAE